MTETVISTPSMAAVSVKKFTAPPVKLACLACRASRTRCDGGNPCAGCRHRARDCVYKPSRRGGARVRRKQQSRADMGAIDDHSTFSQITLQEEVPQQHIDVTNYIDPGAGLKQLQDVFNDSDFIFDSLFMTGMQSSTNGDGTPDASFGYQSQSVPMVRTYTNDQSILDAYYIFIHPYFPILPPPLDIPVDQSIPLLQSNTDGFETGFEPSTPIGLAISAILALIPCANDPNPAGKESVLFRRKYAQYLAQSAIESIEMEDELPESSTEPPKALNGSPRLNDRLSFHLSLPIELECIVALDILSIYEYSQRGNLKKMQSRAGQALVAAMDMSLHCSKEEDAWSEAKRRVWWMTYICASQAAIVSNVEPSFSAFAPSFTAPYPRLQCDSEAFSVLLQAQQAILSATQFVLELKRVLAAKGDMMPICHKMCELEAYLEPLTAEADSWILSSSTTSPVDPSEEVVARTLRCIARIKINSARIKCHRYCAFADVAVFNTKHCDLKSKSDGDNADHQSQRSVNCPCNALTGGPTPSPSASNGSVSPPLSSPSSGACKPRHAFPFSSHQSAKTCLRAALSIAQSFDDLPYPNPYGQLCLPPCTLSPTSVIAAPRTMPSFACCAMQCAYALLMVLNKTLLLYPDSNSRGPMVETLIVQLQAGLKSISGTLENYATAFEALGGMRDQIQSVTEPSVSFI